jgi:CO/xanthine dehydrogenase FAD-binding subunit
MSQIAVFQPKTLPEALGWLASAPEGSRCLAGGTDLMVLKHVQAPLPQNFCDLWSLDELRGVSDDGDALWLGALTTYAEMMSHPLITAHAPLLCEAARSVGAAAIQNRGTLGGNIANASPAGDTLPVLLVHEAEIEVASQEGRRVIPAISFFQGYKKLDLRPGELITRIRLHKQREGERHLWVKVGQRRAQAISKLMLAARASLENGTIQHPRIALGAVAPIPLRILSAEHALRGQRPSEDLARSVGVLACEEVSPISDVRSTVEYRRSVSGNLVARFVRELTRA